MVGSAPPSPATLPDTVYLDFQATTPLDPAVLDVMLPWLNGAHNAHALEHSIGRRAADAAEVARQSVANLLGCNHSEVTFTSGATEASNTVLRGLLRPGSSLAISSLASPGIGARPLGADGWAALKERATPRTAAIAVAGRPLTLPGQRRKTRTSSLLMQPSLAARGGNALDYLL